MSISRFAAFAACLAAGALSSPGAAQAQDEACTYDRCALRVHYGFLTHSIVQGSEGERVARIGIFAPDLDLFAGSDSAAFYYSGFRSAHNSSVWLSIGALAAIATAAIVDTQDADEVVFGSLVIGGGLAIGASIRSLQARERLSTAIWWYNRSLD